MSSYTGHLSRGARIKDDATVWPQHRSLLVKIPRNNCGWTYTIRWGCTVKVGRTTDRKLRRLREAQTWCPGEIDEIAVKPFWNIARLERSLHTAPAA
ncbi:GIY-YIG nuclease family protein [Bradyrhizobium sp. WSM2793]|uniref:GIY-YIG nuclease family protein n=1 Tax=Bradyrhizobium sp. WSM2793 TaxID=1038866 RepID=UPI0035276B2F